MNIPKIIHFIWAGGTRRIPNANLENVKAWAACNPAFEIYLWIDSKNASPEEIELTKQYYREKLDLKEKQEGKLKFKDIEEEKSSLADEEGRIVNEYIRYEIDRLRPNYGASSDLLRYKILYEFGGAYFDSDVKPETNTHLMDIFSRAGEDNLHHLYVNPNSQGDNRIGNDALICTCYNPLIEKIFRTAMKHYQFQLNNISSPDDDIFYNTNQHIAESTSPPTITYLYDDLAYIEAFTPTKTGPACVMKVINVTGRDDLKEADENKESTIGSIENLISLTSNTREWIGKSIQKFIDDTLCISKIKSTMEFEAKEFKLLRLDDHINNLLEASDYYAQDSDSAINMIISLIDKLNLSSLTSIQLTCRYPQTIALCKDRNLLEKTFLFPLVDACQEITGKEDYYVTALSAIMALWEPTLRDETRNICAYKKLLSILEENPLKKDVVMQKLFEIQQATIRFLMTALEYCSNLIKEINLGNKQHFANPKVNLANYLSVISLMINAIKQELSNFYNYLEANQEEKESHLIKQFDNELTDINQDINKFLADYNLKELDNNQRINVEKQDDHPNQDKGDDSDRRCCCRIM